MIKEYIKSYKDFPIEGIDFKCFKYISDNADDNASLDWIENCKKGAKLFQIRMNKF